MAGSATGGLAGMGESAAVGAIRTHPWVVGQSSVAGSLGVFGHDLYNATDIVGRQP